MCNITPEFTIMSVTGANVRAKRRSIRMFVEPEPVAEMRTTSHVVIDVIVTRVCPPERCGGDVIRQETGTGQCLKRSNTSVSKIAEESVM